MPKTGEAFLHQKYPNLHHSPEVTHVVGYLTHKENKKREEIPNPPKKIAAYLGFLANKEYGNSGLYTGDREKIDCEVNKHVIEADDIPKSHFENWVRIAREQGRGDIELTPDATIGITNAIQIDQRASLRHWAQHLSSADVGYDQWYKYYVWNTVTKMSTFEKERGKFKSRTPTTVGPFPELNTEAVSRVYHQLTTHFEGQPAENTETAALLTSGKFDELYAAAFEEIKRANTGTDELDGEWVEYSIGDNPNDIMTITDRALEMVRSLKGHGTDWCIVYDGTATEYLKGGPVSIYFTRDSSGNYTVPRVAIAQKSRGVSEVRGIGLGQDLEAEFTNIVADALQQLPGGNAYWKKHSDMKRVTQIDTMLSQDPQAEVSPEDIAFIFEVNGRKIDGFGDDKDPRIAKLQQALVSERTGYHLGEAGAPEEMVQGIMDEGKVNRLLAKAKDSDASFTDSELRFMYQLDSDITWFNYRNHTLRKDYVELRKRRDQNALLHLLPETIHEQLDDTTSAYMAMAEQLGITATPDDIAQAFEPVRKAWEASDFYSYVATMHAIGLGPYTLVATPNLTLTAGQLADLANNFAKNATLSSQVKASALAPFDPQELSGTVNHVDNAPPVRFSLISPNNFFTMRKSIEDAKATFSDQSLKYPNLNLRLPSVLDTIASWYSLHAHGRDVENIYDYHTAHFDVTPQLKEGKLRIPYTQLHPAAIGFEEAASTERTRYTSLLG